MVDQVVSKATGKVYARKRINRMKRFGHDKQSQKIYENEIRVLSKVADNDHLIKVRGTYTDKKYLVMLLEPVADENLKDYMNRGPLTSVAEQNRFRTYFGCLAHTIRFLHDSAIETLHKDIKLENILLKDGHLILTDFGTAFDWSKTGQSMTRSNAGDHRTPRYQSPEVANASEFHRSSDIWSLGVVFLEMVTILRGKRMAEFDDFLQNNGQRHTSIHLNLDAAMNWFEQLQGHGRGSPIDNEPLVWIKRMLNKEQLNRPTAQMICQDIVSFHDGTFCGPCCSNVESSSDTDEDFQSDTDMLSDIIEHEEVGLGDPLMEHPDASARLDFPHPVLQHAPKDNRTVTFESAEGDSSIYSGNEKDDFDSNASSGIVVTAPLPSEKKVRSQGKSRSRSSVTRGYSQKRKPRSLDDEEPSNSSLATTSIKKVAAKSVSRPFFEKETFVRWLASHPERFKTPTSEHRSAKLSNLSSRPKMRHQTVESLRIGHFLSSLPEGMSGYENASGVCSEGTIETLDPSKRSHTFPILGQQYIQRSHSQERLPTHSHLLTEETDNDQFSDFAGPRLVHYASDGSLNLALGTSEQSLEETKQELKAFATTATIPKCNEPSVTTPIKPEKESKGVSRLSSTDIKTEAVSASKTKTQRSIAQASDAGLAEFPSGSTANTPRLGAYLKDVPEKRKRRWDSATVIMKKILDDKISEAPTSIMSVNTRAKVSRSRPALRWNDKFYGWLPSFVATGKVGAVKEMLIAGCNPGTAEKPRWAPIYNAIRGATDHHTKCLRALVSYGVNVNAVRTTNGRRPLHYAIEKAPWSGYSSVIYTLLAARADPNARDKANDVPLLMLLAGDGRLPQEKRDALYLLIAPNFTTRLDVSIPGTLDNPLHLAVRRKDAYTVDVILEKMKSIGGDALSLMHDYNGSGFTPLLLAFTTFTLAGKEVDDELQIIKLLLEDGANPDSQDVAHGETPLHLIVRASKNTIALELLCRHSANATLLDEAGQSAIDVAQSKKDQWYLFAVRRMRNTLMDDHYRPPELIAFLDEEV